MCSRKEFQKKVKFSLILTFAILVMFSIGSVSSAFGQDHSADKVKTESSALGLGLGLIAAAIAFGLGALGAGIAIGNVGSAAMGAIAEKPELAAQALIFIALGEGLVVFGFVTALMIIGKV